MYGGTRYDRNFTLAYQPHTRTILECYTDTISLMGVSPFWVVNSKEVQSHPRTDSSTGNKIAIYTYVADDTTSKTILECTCDCHFCLQCRSPVVVTIEGT